jgi:hypothetical protein
LREIALHLLDIAENSVAAQARMITILVCEDFVHDRLRATVTDDGKGMDAETLARVTDPFMTSRSTRKVGLGIPLLKAAAEACNGFLQIRSSPGNGACLEVEFQWSHIDRMPLGDLSGTLLTLVVAYPDIHWLFQYRRIRPGPESKDANPDKFQTAVFDFDSQPIKDELEDIPFSEPEVLAFLRNLLDQGISGVQMTVPDST